MFLLVLARNSWDWLETSGGLKGRVCGSLEFVSL